MFRSKRLTQRVGLEHIVMSKRKTPVPETKRKADLKGSPSPAPADPPAFKLPPSALGRFAESFSDWETVRLPEIKAKNTKDSIVYYRDWPAEDSMEWRRLVYAHKKIYEYRRSFPRASIKEALLGIPPQYPSDASGTLLKLKMEADFTYSQSR